MMRNVMYDQEEETRRGAVQGWTNCFPPPARGDDKYSKQDLSCREREDKLLV